MKREEDVRRALVRSVVIGSCASMLLFLLLMLISLFSNHNHTLIDHSDLAAKSSLAVISFLCSMFCAGKLRQNRLIHALAGNGVILLCLIAVGSIFGFCDDWGSVMIDSGIVLFGAFAGALLHSGAKRKRRGKR